MRRYFICLLASLTIVCCFTLQPAEATDDKGIRIGLGYSHLVSIITFNRVEV